MEHKPKKWGWLVLFASTSTLVCCVIPIILVLLGFGSTVAFLAANVPYLVELSQNKIWVFLITGLLLALGAWALYRPGRTCPTDPELAKACNSAHKWNTRLWLVAVTLWVLGFATAYLLVPVLDIFGLL